jgi:hypothetical protein
MVSLFLYSMKTEAETELEQIAEAVRPRRSLNDENDAATIARVFAENARFRAALEEIGAYKGEGGPNTPWQAIVRDLGQTARDALG